MLIQLLNLKGRGGHYVLLNLLSIFGFFIIYHILSMYENIYNPWYYWLYFSAITQTTVGYSGIKTKYDDKEKDSYTDISILSIKSSLFKACIMFQLLSIILINGYFLSI